MTPKDAQQRLHILNFFDKYGLQATIDAFESPNTPSIVGRLSSKPQVTIRGTCRSFTSTQKAPHSQGPKEVIRQIRLLRKRYPNLGKARVQVLLKLWCIERGLPCPSISTIGRIISRAPDKMRVIPTRLNAKGRLKPVKRDKKVRKPKRLKILL